MANLYAYKTVFEPILLPGETARIILPSQTIDVECVAVGALPLYTKDFGALTAATWDTGNQDTNLDMQDFQLAQYRIRIQDDMLLKLNNPASTRQWRTKGTDFYLPQFPTDPEDQFLQEFYFKASEFFVYEDDNSPSFDLYSANDSTTSRVLFSGWRFSLRKSAVPGKATIWVSGWPSGVPAR